MKHLENIDVRKAKKERKKLISLVDLQDKFLNGETSINEETSAVTRNELESLKLCAYILKTTNTKYRPEKRNKRPQSSQRAKA